MEETPDVPKGLKTEKNGGPTRPVAPLKIEPEKDIAGDDDQGVGKGGAGGANLPENQKIVQCGCGAHQGKGDGDTYGTGHRVEVYRGISGLRYCNLFYLQ